MAGILASVFHLVIVPTLNYIYHILKYHSSTLLFLTRLSPAAATHLQTFAVNYFLHTTSWVSIIGYEPEAQVAKKNQNQLVIYISLFS